MSWLESDSRRVIALPLSEFRLAFHVVPSCCDQSISGRGKDRGITNMEGVEVPP